MFKLSHLREVQIKATIGIFHLSDQERSITLIKYGVSKMAHSISVEDNLAVTIRIAMHKLLELRSIPQFHFNEYILKFLLA